MTELLCCCVMFAAFIIVALKLDKLARSNRDLAERYFFVEESHRRMERAANLNEEAVKGMMAHFTLPPVSEPLPLPPVEDAEPTHTGKRKRKRG